MFVAPATDQGSDARFARPLCERRRHYPSATAATTACQSACATSGCTIITIADLIVYRRETAGAAQRESEAMIPIDGVEFRAACYSSPDGGSTSLLASATSPATPWCGCTASA